jgi:hypothetical protein
VSHDMLFEGIEGHNDRVVRASACSMSALSAGVGNPGFYLSGEEKSRIGMPVYHSLRTSSCSAIGSEMFSSSLSSVELMSRMSVNAHCSAILSSNRITEADYCK